MVNLSDTTKKLLFGFLVVALLAPGAYVAIQRIDAQPAYAVPTEEFLSLPWAIRWIIEFGLTTVEHIGYKYLKKTLAELGHNLAVQGLRDFSQAGQGQEPMFEIRGLGDFLVDDMEAGGGLFLEGAVVGFEGAEKTRKGLDKIKEDDARYEAEIADAETGINLLPKQEEFDAATRDLKIDIATSEGERTSKADEIARNSAKYQDAQERYGSACNTDKNSADCKKASELFTQTQTDLSQSRAELQEIEAGIRADQDNLSDTVARSAAAERERRKFGGIIKEKEAAIKHNDVIAIHRKRYDELSRTRDSAQAGVSQDARSIIRGLCNQNFSIAFRLIFGLPGVSPEQKSLCTIKQLTKNWDDAINRTGIKDLFNPGKCCWKQLGEMISPYGTEPMAALQLQSSYFDQEVESASRAASKWMTDSIVGSKPVKSLAGMILTPGSAVKKMVDESIETAAKQTVMPALTGTLMADLIDLADTFASSFAQKSFSLIMKGIAARIRPRETAKGPSGAAPQDSLTDPEAPPVYSQKKASAIKMVELAKLEFSEKDIKVLSELQTDQNCKDNPNYCVLSDGFAEAITEKMTVGEALCLGGEKGCESKLNPSGIFGFKNVGAEAGVALCTENEMNSCQAFKTDFPYYIMPILRKYRVIPVGWEIAALYIKAVPNACAQGKSCTISDVVEKYNVSSSPFYRLVDPNWVLKLPAAKCSIWGYGPAAQYSSAADVPEDNKLCTDDTNNDGRVACNTEMLSDKGDVSVRKACGLTGELSDAIVLRVMKNFTDLSVSKACKDAFDDYNIIPVRPKACLDEQTCLRENPNGSCQNFGYCLEERKKVVFRGTTGNVCNEKIVSCQSFTNDETDQTITILKRTIPGMDATYTRQTQHDSCSKNYAGCKWYSKKRNSDNAAITAEWSSAWQDRVYLTSALNECQEEFAGCTALKKASDAIDAAFRVPPPELQCDKTVRGVPGYKREECRDYALQCGVEYTGCALYAPTNGDPRVAGTGPAACRAGCAGLANFLEKSTDIERRFGPEVLTATAIFVPSSASSCPSTEVGCEEFTDLDAERQGSGESLFTFSKIKACVPRPAKSEPRNFFYSWYGSDQSGGSRLVKFEFAHEIPAGSTNPVPKCAEGTVCDCAGHLNEDDPVKGKCREFISVTGTTGTISLRWTDLLVHPVDGKDCHSYRRTIGENIYTLSRTLSRSCRSSSVGCHEYRAPNSGNVQVIFSDDFESKSNRMWYAIGTANSTMTPVLAKPSSDTETLYETSIRHADVATLYRDLGSVSLLKSSKYLLDFMVKPDAAATVTGVALVTKDASGNLSSIATGASRDSSANSVALPAGQWTNARMYFDLSGLSTDRATGTQIRISFAPATGADGVTLTADRFIFKRLEGVEYKRKGSWTVRGDQCENAAGSIEYTKYGTYQYECRQYKPDAGGIAVNYQGFSRLCPVEMVGCSEFTVPGSKKVVFADRFNFDNWTTSGGSVSSRTSIGDTVEVTGSPNATTDHLAIRRPARFKSNTAYTVTLRFKETTPDYKYEQTGERGFKALNVQLLKTANDSSPLTLATTDAAINIENRQYSPWRSFTFTSKTPTFDASEIDGFIQVYAVGAITTHSYALDDIVLAETRTPNSLYLVADSQKSCPKAETGCTAYGVPVLNSAGRVKTEVKKLPNSDTTLAVEKWTEKVFRITPEQIAFSPSTPGVCQEQHLRCSSFTYTDKFGDEQTQKQAFFRDPGDRICKVKKVGDRYSWTKSVCSGTDTPCKKAGDCGKDASDAEIKCEEKNCLIFPALEPPTSTPPLDANPNKPHWLYQCPTESDTCRKITDPECGQSTLSLMGCTDANKKTICVDSNKRFTGACMTKNADGTLAPVTGTTLGLCQLDAFVLRTEYGRNNPGIACTRDYYYLSDVSTRGCEGTVDVEKGCLLFHDDAVGSAATDKYNSGAFYSQFWGTRGVNPNPISLNDASGSTLTSNPKDANIVLKARYDRECKTSLVCTDYIKGGGSLVCLKRRPCEVGSSASCVKPLSPAGDGTDQLAGTFTAPVGNTTNPNLTYLSLSGLSRPNFSFPAITNPASASPFPARTIGGGHNGTFNWDQSSVKSERPILQDSARSDTYATYFGHEGGLAVSSTPTDIGNYLMNSCRVYPRADTPDSRQHITQKESHERSWINSCYYSKEGISNAEIRGLYGYCLEPNPKYYSGTLADYRTLAKINPKDGGYRSFCLNWHPIDRIAEQPPLSSDAGSLYPGLVPVYAGSRYHCVASSKFDPERLDRKCKNRRSSGADILGSQDGESEQLNDCKDQFHENRVTRNGENVGFIPGSWGGQCGSLNGTNQCIDELADDYKDNFFFLHADHKYNGWKDQDNMVEIDANDKEKDLPYGQIQSITYELIHDGRGQYYQTCDDAEACRGRTERDPIKETIPKGTNPNESFTYIQRDADAREREYSGPTLCWWCNENKYFREPITRENVFIDVNLSSSLEDSYMTQLRLCGAKRLFLGIQPTWIGEGTSKRLKGWKWRLCNSEWDIFTLKQKVAMVKVSIELDSSRDFGAYLDRWGTMCSEFVTLTDENGSNVQWRTKPMPEHSISWKNDADQDAPKFDSGNPNRKFVLSSREQDYEIVRSSFWNSSPLERERKPPGAPGTDDAGRIGKNDGLTVISTGDISKDYYARLYEYWKWDGSKYVRRAYVDKDEYKAEHGDATYKNILQSKWKANMAAAIPPTIRNLTIVPDFKTGEANPGEWIVSSGLRRVELSFQIDANPDQLPIRFFQIDWGDTNTNGIQWQAFDGSGYKIERSPGSSSGTDPSTSTNTLHTYTYSHMYALDVLKDKGSKICVRAIDNFRAGVKTCANISADSAGCFKVGQAASQQQKSTSPDALSSLNVSAGAAAGCSPNSAAAPSAVQRRPIQSETNYD